MVKPVKFTLEFGCLARDEFLAAPWGNDVSVTSYLFTNETEYANSVVNDDIDRIIDVFGHPEMEETAIPFNVFYELIW